jgi:toxin ParE1/3/4
LAKLESFLQRKYSDTLAKQQISSIKTKVNAKLTVNPYIAPTSQRLLSLGIYQCRQWAVDKHNIVFYRIDEEHSKVVLLVVMDSRQSIEKLLYELVLLS